MEDNIVNETTSLLEDSFREFLNTTAEYLPNILGALLLIIVGLILAGLLARGTKQLLMFFNVHKLEKREGVSNFIKQAGIRSGPVDLAGSVVKWVTIIVFAMAAVDVLGLTALRDVFREFIAYLPNVLAAAIIVAATIAAARIVRDFIRASLKKMDFSAAASVATLSQGIVIAFGVVFALAQLGLDTTLLTANITLIIGGVLLTLALAFGLGGQGYAQNLLAGYHVRVMYDVGDQYSDGRVRGKISDINLVSMTIDTAEGTKVVPHKKVLNL